jgi:hypothetical protein
VKDLPVNKNFIKCQRTKRKWRYFCLFEDGMTYHFSFNKETKEFSRHNMTSTGLNTFFIKNKRFPTATELTEVDSICITQIKKTFAKELKLN